MNQDQTRWKEFRKELLKFPDVRDCLIKSERDSEQPNLLRIDWRKVGTGHGAEICVFRIARSLQDVELIRQWLIYHKFRLGNLNPVFGENHTPQYETEHIYSLEGYWTTEQYRKINPSWFVSLTGYDLVLSYGLLFGFSKNLTVVGTFSTPSTK